jgi:hypothetical protein
LSDFKADTPDRLVGCAVHVLIACVASPQPERRLSMPPQQQGGLTGSERYMRAFAASLAACSSQVCLQDALHAAMRPRCL